MKKAGIAGIILAIGLLIYYVGTSSSLMSSVLIGNVSFPDGTPKTREEALINTIDGFTLTDAKTSTVKVVNQYVATYEATTWSTTARKKINVTVSPLSESILNTSRAGLVNNFSKNALRFPELYSLVTFEGENAFILKMKPNTSPGQIIWFTWPSSGATVTITFNSISSNVAQFATIDWPAVRQNILKITQAYMTKYPPIDAKEYGTFWGNATEFMGKIDLTKLPVISFGQ